MDRHARLSGLAALLALGALAGSPGLAQRRGADGNVIFEPTGRTVQVHHMGFIGLGCEPPTGPLRIEARTAEGVFRITNPTRRQIVFHYDWAGSFGDYQMFFLRIADGEGEPVPLGDEGCGWWSPKVNHATLQMPGEYPQRRLVTIPARGHADIPIDLAALTYWWGYNHHEAVTGPCMMQIRLFGYAAPRSWVPVSAETSWFPVPCPAPGP